MNPIMRLLTSVFMSFSWAACTFLKVFMAQQVFWSHLIHMLSVVISITCSLCLLHMFWSFVPHVMFISITYSSYLLFHMLCPSVPHVLAIYSTFSSHLFLMPKLQVSYAVSISLTCSGHMFNMFCPFSFALAIHSTCSGHLYHFSILYAFDGFDSIMYLISYISGFLFSPKCHLIGPFLLLYILLLTRSYVGHLFYVFLCCTQDT